MNTKKAVIDHCKRAVEQGSRIVTLHPHTKIIPEADVYRLIMKSTLAAAEKFADWIKAQIARARLAEEREYFTETSSRRNQTGRGGDRRSKDYFITIDAAKHIAMMSGTEKGFEVREYFIEVEKRYAEAPTIDYAKAEARVTGMFGGLKMSSREIAELTGKRHDNVMVDIRKLISDKAIDPLNFQEISLPDSYGRPQPAFMLRSLRPG